MGPLTILKLLVAPTPQCRDAAQSPTMACTPTASGGLLCSAVSVYSHNDTWRLKQLLTLQTAWSGYTPAAAWPGHITDAIFSPTSFPMDALLRIDHGHTGQTDYLADM